MTSPLESCPNYAKDRKAALAHLEQCIEQLREAQSHLGWPYPQQFPSTPIRWPAENGGTEKSRVSTSIARSR